MTEPIERVPYKTYTVNIEVPEDAVDVFDRIFDPSIAAFVLLEAQEDVDANRVYTLNLVMTTKRVFRVT